MRALFQKIFPRYARRMAIHRRPSEPMRPLPYLRELDRYVGKWVAVKDGHVVTFADTSTELALRLRELGADGRGAVMQFVRPEADSYIVGVG